MSMEKTMNIMLDAAKGQLLVILDAAKNMYIAADKKLEFNELLEMYKIPVVK